MEEHTLSALIDQYLLGTISTQDRAYLEELIVTDPTVAELVKESKMAYKAILFERNRRLREKLRDLDNEVMQRQDFFSTGIGKLSFLLGCLFVLFYLASVYFSPASIARRNFVDFSISALVAEGHQEQETARKEAKDAFMRKEYEIAIQHYVSLSEQPDTEFSFPARWNILMAQLALEGPTKQWKIALDSYTREAPGPIAAKAYKLAAFFESGYYKLLHKHFRENLSSLKPRLI